MNAAVAAAPAPAKLQAAPGVVLECPTAGVLDGHAELQGRGGPIGGSTVPIRP